MDPVYYVIDLVVITTLIFFDKRFQLLLDVYIESHFGYFNQEAHRDSFSIYSKLAAFNVFFSTFRFRGNIFFKLLLLLTNEPHH